MKRYEISMYRDPGYPGKSAYSVLSADGRTVLSNMTRDEAWCVKKALNLETKRLREQIGRLKQRRNEKGSPE